MIGIMETVDLVLAYRCCCSLHLQRRRRNINFAMSYGFGKQRLLDYARSIMEDSGQDIAEYAVMLAVIIVLALGILQLIGHNASNVFSQIGSKIQ